MMRIFVLVSLFALTYGLRDKYYTVECPIPDNGQLPADEAECAKYPACVWESDGSGCHMNKNDQAGYIVSSNQTDTGRGFKVSVTKADMAATLFNGDIEVLDVEVIYHQNDHVQIKITDPADARYEVPIPVNLPSTAETEPIYTVTAGDLGDPLVLTVTRTSTGAEIFKNVGPLTFEDQFIQFTTQLASRYVYGIGENQHSSLKHSFSERTTWPLFARDQPDVTGSEANQYGSQPYFINIENDEGDTHSVLFLNSNAMEFSTFLLLNGDPAITMRSIGGIIDFHLFLGPTPELVHNRYVETIGKPEFPPYWALGFQLSRYGYGSGDNYTVIRNRTRDAGIPQDVQVFDIDYMDRFRDFTYDKTNWADLPQIINDLHAENIKVVLILDPAIAIDMSYPTYARGKASDVFIKWEDSLLVPADQPGDADDYVVGYVWPDNKTVFPDFFKTQTLDWWTTELMDLHDILPYDGIWIDMNEPANFGTNMDRPFNYPSSEPDWSLKCPFNTKDSPPYPTKATTMDENDSKRLSDKTICMSSVQTDGVSNYSHYDVHSLYGYTETIATEKALEVVFPGYRPAILSRSTFPGSGVAGIHWLGDNHAIWSQLRTSIIGMVEFNMFGIPMVGADVCGFGGEPSEQLCIRWMQLGAFYPFDRNHNSLGSPDQDPARPDWTQVSSISRDILLVRYALLPYFYSILHRAHMNGYSVIRPLFITFPTDLYAREVDDQFMWSRELMVAPVVVENATERIVYFSESLWYDYYNGSLVSNGSENKTVSAPIDFIPLYIRGGSIIPTQKAALTTVQSRQNNFTFAVALDVNFTASGELYMDDAVSFMSMTETYLASITYSGNKLVMTQNHDPTILQNRYLERVEFYGYPADPTSITLNGLGLDPGSWTYDTNANLTIVLSHHMTDDFEIIINY